jgi:hypothetical protein
MQMSTLVATLGEERKIHNIDNDEPFVLTSLDFKKFSIPMLCSDYILSSLHGRVEVIGYITCEYVMKDGRKSLFTYLQAVDIRQVPEETAEVNNVTVSAKLTKIGEYRIYEKTTKVSLLVIGRHPCADGKTSVLHMKAVGSAARKLKSATPEQHITGSGYINPRGVPIEIILTKADFNERGGH